jgi:hypothetical protein
MENRISGGELLSETDNYFTKELGSTFENSRLNLTGGFRLTQQTKPPLPDQGDIGEVRWVDDGKSSALWVKTTSGWMQSKLQK